MKVYLDIFFLVNAWMNMVVLLAESILQKRKTRLRRIVLAAVIGALQAMIIVLLGVHRYLILFFICYLLGGILIVRIAFGKTTIGAMIHNLLFFYGMEFLFGGLLLHLQNALMLPANFLFMVLAATGLLILLRWAVPVIYRRKRKAEQYYPVQLEVGGHHYQGMGLLDTGNQLREPFHQRPVTVCEADLLQKLFEEKEAPLLRYIPFHSLGEESGMLAVFQADAITIEKEEGKRCCYPLPWIALYDHYVSVDGEYQFILHPDMLINQ